MGDRQKKLFKAALAAVGRVVISGADPETTLRPIFERRFGPWNEEQRLALLALVQDILDQRSSLGLRDHAAMLRADVTLVGDLTATLFRPPQAVMDAARPRTPARALGTAIVGHPLIDEYRESRAALGRNVKPKPATMMDTTSFGEAVRALDGSGAVAKNLQRRPEPAEASKPRVLVVDHMASMLDRIKSRAKDTFGQPNQSVGRYQARIPAPEGIDTARWLDVLRTSGQQVFERDGAVWVTLSKPDDVEKLREAMERANSGFLAVSMSSTELGGVDPSQFVGPNVGLPYYEHGSIHGTAVRGPIDVNADRFILGTIEQEVRQYQITGVEPDRLASPEAVACWPDVATKLDMAAAAARSREAVEFFAATVEPDRTTPQVAEDGRPMIEFIELKPSPYDEMFKETRAAHAHFVVATQALDQPCSLAERLLAGEGVPVGETTIDYENGVIRRTGADAEAHREEVKAWQWAGDDILDLLGNPVDPEKPHAYYADRDESGICAACGESLADPIHENITATGPDLDGYSEESVVLAANDLPEN